MNFALLKAAVALALAPASFDGIRGRMSPWVERRSTPMLAMLFGATRLVLAIAAFELAGLKTPSDASYYAQFATSVLTTGRNPASPYSPGFDYLMAGLLHIFGSPDSYTYFLIAAETLAFGVFVATMRRLQSAHASSLAFLWFVSPISILNVALGGQDEALILMFWCGVAWFIASERSAAAGLLVTVAVLCTKVLGVFTALPIMTARRGLARAAGIGLVAGVGATWFLWQRGIPLMGFLRESNLVTSGNVWAVWAVATGGPRPVAHPWQFGVAAIAMIAALVFMRQRPLRSPPDQMLRVSGAIGCLFLLLSPKAFTAYLVIFLPGILFLMLKTSPAVRTVLLLTFVPALGFEASLWFYFREGATLGSLWWGRPSILATDIVLLLGYAWLALRGLSYSMEETDFAKRLLDVTLSGVGLVVSLPVSLAAAAAVKLQDGGPVFFGQERVGKNGHIFHVLKFRSMIPDAEAKVGALQASAGDARITKVGHFLRATALDELPQLWNIFCGDMSFVGPRALRPGEIEVSGGGKHEALEDVPGFEERCRVRPGLTGIAQIFAPRDIPRRQKFRYDKLYIRKQAFSLDLRLIMLSFWITFRGTWEARGKKF